MDCKKNLLAMPANSLRIYPWIGVLALLLACRPQEVADIPSSSAAKGWAFPGFEKVDSLNPILVPAPAQSFLDPIRGETVSWEARNVLNPTAVVRGDSVYLLYRAQDESGTSRIGMAVSADGLHFGKRPEPVFYPAEDSLKVFEWNYRKSLPMRPEWEDCASCFFDGVEDPRVVESESGTYLMTYTAYDGRTARLSLATSSDLRHWEKHGPVLKGIQYKDYWSKSGALVVAREGNRIVARKLNGKYWMYFGDTDLYMVSSEDLIHWEPALNAESDALISVLHPRPGYFDSRLVEPGPFALLREEGILLIYNASNAANFNDTELPKFTYAAGQALFHPDRPWQLLERTERYFIHPDKDYERVGEVNEVCFVEGLVHFRAKWFLYYGTADSRIAVAVYDPFR